MAKKKGLWSRVQDWSKKWNKTLSIATSFIFVLLGILAYLDNQEANKMSGLAVLEVQNANEEKQRTNDLREKELEQEECEQVYSTLKINPEIDPVTRLNVSNISLYNCTKAKKVLSGAVADEMESLQKENLLTGDVTGAAVGGGAMGSLLWLWILLGLVVLIGGVWYWLKK